MKNTKQIIANNKFMAISFIILVRIVEVGLNFEIPFPCFASNI